MEIYQQSFPVYPLFRHTICEWCKSADNSAKLLNEVLHPDETQANRRHLLAFYLETAFSTQPIGILNARSNRTLEWESVYIFA